MGWLSALTERHSSRTNPYHFDFTSMMFRTSFLMLVLFLALFFAFRSSPAYAQATTPTKYFVDCAVGSDNNSGQAMTAPWKTIARANDHTYLPGDSILLARGCTYGVGLDLLDDRGTATAPITVGSYGEGTPPVIDPFQDAALYAENIQHVVIEDIVFTNHGYAPKNVDAEKGTDNGGGTPGLKSTVEIWGLGPAGVKNCGDACLTQDITIRNIEVDGGTEFTEFAPGRFRVADGSDGNGRGIFISGGQYNAGAGFFSQ